MKLIKFEADWCAPCHMQSEILDGFDLVDLEVHDIDEPEGMELADEFGIAGIPTMVLVDDDGEELERWVGVTQLDELEAGIGVHNG